MPRHDFDFPVPRTDGLAHLTPEYATRIFIAGIADKVAQDPDAPMKSPHYLSLFFGVLLHAEGALATKKQVGVLLSVLHAGNAIAVKIANCVPAQCTPATQNMPMQVTNAGQEANVATRYSGEQLWPSTAEHFSTEHEEFGQRARAELSRQLHRSIQDIGEVLGLTTAVANNAFRNVLVCSDDGVENAFYEYGIWGVFLREQGGPNAEFVTVPEIRAGLE